MQSPKTNITRTVAGWTVQRTTTHPGALIREDFLIPADISANQLALRTRIPPPASARSSMAAGQSPPTPRSGSPATSEPRPSSGSICRPPMTSQRPEWNLAPSSSATSSLGSRCPSAPSAAPIWYR